MCTNNETTETNEAAVDTTVETAFLDNFNQDDFDSTVETTMNSIEANADVLQGAPEDVAAAVEYMVAGPDAAFFSTGGDVNKMVEQVYSSSKTISNYLASVQAAA